MLHHGLLPIRKTLYPYLSPTVIFSQEVEATAAGRNTMPRKEPRELVPGHTIWRNIEPADGPTGDGGQVQQPALHRIIRHEHKRVEDSGRGRDREPSNVRVRWVASRVASALDSIFTNVGMNSVREMIFSYNLRMSVLNKNNGASGCVILETFYPDKKPHKRLHRYK